MNNYTAILVLWLCIPILLFAQEENNNRQFGNFRSGIRLGLCTSQIDGDNYGGYNKVGLTGGGLIATPVSKRLDVQLEINYCNRGSRDPADPEKGKFNSYRINLHYIDIPLLVMIQTWKFKFEFGITNGIFIASKEEDEFGLVTNSVFNFNRYELALNAGANLLITKNWIFNVRYHRSVLPIANERVIVPGFGFLGGSYNDAILFSIVRYFNPQ